MLLGVVPLVGPVYSQQSAKSVYPLAIANCQENRYVFHIFHSSMQVLGFPFSQVLTMRLHLCTKLWTTSNSVVPVVIAIMFYFIVNANRSINLFQVQLRPFDRTDILVE